MNPISPTLVLSKLIANTQYSQLNSTHQDKLQGLFLDYLRVASVGQKMSWSNWAKNYTQKTAGIGISRVLFSDRSIDPVSASFLNTIYAGSIEADDVHVGAMLHPGCIVFSVALALSQDKTMENIMSAVAVGYEAMIRVGLCIQPSHFARGYQSTATCGVFGAAATAAYLCLLDVKGDERIQKIAQTLGIAASGAGGLVQFFHSGSTVKRLHAAQAASTGIKAALLMLEGFSGPLDILEGKDGFFKAYSDTFNAKFILEHDSECVHLDEVAVKPHACSARVLSAIEATCEIFKHQSIAIENISKITLGIPKVIQGRLTSNTPKDLQEAQMSAPFAIAMSIMQPACWSGGALNIDDFEVGVQNQSILNLSQLVECVLDQEVELTSNSESVSAKVTVLLKDGSQYQSFIESPLGSVHRPFNYANHYQRLSAELSKRYAPDQFQKIMASIDHLNHKSRIDSLLTLLN